MDTFNPKQNTERKFRSIIGTIKKITASYNSVFCMIMYPKPRKTLKCRRGKSNHRTVL